MKSCSNCRTKFDPTFTLHCPDCGTSIDPSVGSMTVPKPEPVGGGRPADRGAPDIGGVPAGPAGDALRRSGIPSARGRLLKRIGVRVALAAVALSIGGVISYVEDRGSGLPTNVTFDTIEAADFALGDFVNAAELSIGDCVNWPADGEDTFQSLERLDCARPHDAEVFALVDHPANPDEEYPGSDTVADWGLQACYEEFAPYVGQTYEQAKGLDYTFFTPTELGWTKYDERLIQCLIFKLDDSTLMGTVQAGA